MISLNKQPKNIRVDDMKDGQIAIITDWSPSSHAIGAIVQRWGNHLVRLGWRDGNSWHDFFKTPCDSDLKVRLLDTNDTLYVNNDNIEGESLNSRN